MYIIPKIGTQKRLHSLIIALHIPHKTVKTLKKDLKKPEFLTTLIHILNT